MRKIIAIGESVLDTVFRDGQPQRSFVGGRVANIAASLGTTGLPVTMVSECASDEVGDMIVRFMQQHNVNVNSIDRYTDGSTAFSAIFASDDGDKIINYGRYPQDRFDVVWPRIDEDDIVIFGSLYAIDTPQRERLWELVSYAAERKAILVYLPGFQHGINFRITRVMPAILENFEVSHLVVAHDQDMNVIFPGEPVDYAFQNHIGFYGSTLVHVHSNLDVTVYRHNEHTNTAEHSPAEQNLLGWQSGLTVGLIHEMLLAGITHKQLPSITTEQWAAMATDATVVARACAASADNCVPAELAKRMAQQLQAAAEQTDQQ